MDRKRYPLQWNVTSFIVRESAKWKCEFCEKECRRPGEPFYSHKYTLTTAHIDHDPENPNARLLALCAPCHRKYDAKNREKINQNRWEASGQMKLFEYEGDRQEKPTYSHCFSPLTKK